MSTPMWEREGVSAPVAGLRDALRTGRGAVERVSTLRERPGT
jgi:hypothetical protein